MVEIAGTQKTTDTKGFATLAQAIALTETTSLVGIDVTKDEVVRLPAPNHAATTTCSPRSERSSGRTRLTG
jgi:hypothetical protein